MTSSLFCCPDLASTINPHVAGDAVGQAPSPDPDVMRGGFKLVAVLESVGVDHGGYCSDADISKDDDGKDVKTTKRELYKFKVPFDFDPETMLKMHTIKDSCVELKYDAVRQYASYLGERVTSCPIGSGHCGCDWKHTVTAAFIVANEYIEEFVNDMGLKWAC